MTITIAVAGRPPFTTAESLITLGSHPSCMIAFPDCADVKSIHATIQEVAGRWVIESCKGDLLVVGASDPATSHPLKPGDVIQLSEKSPQLTFEPVVDDFLPVPAEDDSGPFRLLPIDEGPTPSGTLRTRRPPSSESIPVSEGAPTDKSSDRILTTKSPSSGSIPTSKSPSKPRSSGTIRAVNSAPGQTPPEDGAPGSSPSGTKLPPKSNTNIPARKSDADQPSTGGKRARSSGQMPVYKSTDEEPIADLPVLQRSSSWEEELPPAPRRGRSSDQAEMQWIMMVVGRSLAGGAAILVSWLALSLLWKALNTPPMDAPSSASVATVGETTAAGVSTPPATPPAHVAPYVPPRPKPPANVEKGTKNSLSTVAATPTTPATTTSQTELATTTESSKGNGKTDDKVTEKTNDKTDDEAASGFLAGIESETEMAVGPVNPAEDEMADEDEPDEAALSPLLLSSMDSIYAIVVEDPVKKRTRQVGTAWAASEHHLVTSATVARLIEEARQQNRLVYALHPTSDRKVQIAAIRMHNNYREAARAVDQAIEKRNEKRQLTLQKAQVRFDLAVLNVSPSEKLEAFLQFVTGPIKNSKDATFSMVGLPFEKPDPKADVAAELCVLKERHARKPLSSTPVQNKDHSLTIQFNWHEKDPNWSGSPVLNKDNEVIGIYAQLLASKTPESKKGRPESAVVWLGFLRDFAADVGSKSHGLDD